MGNDERLMRATSKTANTREKKKKQRALRERSLQGPVENVTQHRRRMNQHVATRKKKNKKQQIFCFLGVFFIQRDHNYAACMLNMRYAWKRGGRGSNQMAHYCRAFGRNSSVFVRIKIASLG